MCTHKHAHAQKIIMSAGDHAMISVQCCVKIYWQAEVQTDRCIRTSLTYMILVYANFTLAQDYK